MTPIRVVVSAMLLAVGLAAHIQARAQFAPPRYTLHSSPDIPSITTKAQQDDVIALLSAHLAVWAAQEAAQSRYEQIVTPEAVFEYPYAKDSAQYIEGREAIAKAVGQRSRVATDWQFSDLRLFKTAYPDIFFVAYNSSAYVAATGRPYKQSYLARITVKEGKIDNYLELWDRGLEPAAL